MSSHLVSSLESKVPFKTHKGEEASLRLMKKGLSTLARSLIEGLIELRIVTIVSVILSKPSSWRSRETES